jgi:hypothetical protein
LIILYYKGKGRLKILNKRVKMAKKKKIANRVFISDIHLMDGRSMEAQPGWKPMIKRENK